MDDLPKEPKDNLPRGVFTVFLLSIPIWCVICGLTLYWLWLK